MTRTGTGTWARQTGQVDRQGGTGHGDRQLDRFGSGASQTKPVLGRRV